MLTWKIFQKYTTLHFLKKIYTMAVIGNGGQGLFSNNNNNNTHTHKVPAIGIDGLGLFRKKNKPSLVFLFFTSTFFSFFPKIEKLHF
jgi:hypothetical protein